jgi:hypothetical protein
MWIRRRGLRLLVLAACVGFVWACEQSGVVEHVVTVTEIDRQGFVLTGHNPSWIRDTLILTLACSELTDPLPLVALDDSIVAPSYTSMTGFTWWFGGRRVGDEISYCIALGEDTLVDTLRIPHRIDSVFCNGQFMPKGRSDTMEVRERFELRWSSQDVPYYQAQIFCSLADRPSQTRGLLDTVLSQNQLGVPVAHDGSEITHLSVSVRTFYAASEEAANTMPPLRSGRIHCYRQVIKGPKYSCYVIRSDSL